MVTTTRPTTTSAPPSELAPANLTDQGAGSEATPSNATAPTANGSGAPASGAAEAPAPPAAPPEAAPPAADAPASAPPAAQAPAPPGEPIRVLDQTGPRINSFSLTCSGVTRSVTWTIEVTDPSGVKAVTAKFSAEGVTESALVMVVQPGVYRVRMHAPVVDIVTVTAVDKFGNKTSAKRSNLCVN